MPIEEDWLCEPSMTQIQHDLAFLYISGTLAYVALQPSES